jgi:dTMP kinase
MNQQAKFVTFEGIEGVGKSTCIATLAGHLKKKNIEYVLTREPGGTAIGEALRSILLSEHSESIESDTECLMVFAARAQHIKKVVHPNLTAGIWVISDRFTDSTYAYQGGGRKIPTEKIAQLEQWVHPNLQPDLTILLDADLEIALLRAKERGQADRFEGESLEFFKAARDVYLQRAKEHADRFRIIDANQALPAVQEQLHKLVEEWLSEHAEL